MGIAIGFIFAVKLLYSVDKAFNIISIFNYPYTCLLSAIAYNNYMLCYRDNLFVSQLAA
jgi:hypothetical protein